VKEQRIAISVFPIVEKIDDAFQHMLELVRLAKRKKCNLILFPEAVLGGLQLCGNFEIDSRKTLSPAASELIRGFARDEAIGIGFGFLELADELIYDSYMIFDHKGEPCLHYRRVSNTWLPGEISSGHYACGASVPAVQTPYGRLGILLCGDLFDPALVQQLSKQGPTLCLHPMARAFDYTDDMQQLWDETEMPYYLDEYRKLRADVLVCNALSPGSKGEEVYCGGAWFIRENQVVSSLPLMQEGLLIVDI